MAGTGAKRAGRSFVSASHSAARAGAAAAGGATRTVHRLTGASGAGATGLSHLIELTGAGTFGDAFVVIALAGTLFFSTSVEQARGRVALALLITMAPFAVLAPFIGPMLDRARKGRRYILIGTLLARGLLCWGMAGAVQYHDAVTLLPAAFGVLVLQKAYAVTRAAVTPRLLPSRITLVTANARIALASLIASSLGGGAAAGIDWVFGGGSGGAAWVLRIGTIVYIVGIVPGLRLPDGLDTPDPADEQPAAHGRAEANGAGERADGPHPPSAAERSAVTQPIAGFTGVVPEPGSLAGSGPEGYPGTARGPADGSPAGAGIGGGQASKGKRRIALPRVGPVVAEAMAGNATLRAYSGFMIFFLAFLLRSVHFGTVSDKVALAALIGAGVCGGFLGTAIGSAARSRAPQAIIFGMMMLVIATTIICAVYFGLLAALVVALAAALGQSLVKLALDSIVQREIPEEVRSSTFAASETLHQLSWVVGGLAGLALSLTNSGVAGLTVAACGVLVSLIMILLRRRRRVLRARRQPHRSAA
jgi:MFS family permease